MLWVGRVSKCIIDSVCLSVPGALFGIGSPTNGPCVGSDVRIRLTLSRHLGSGDAADVTSATLWLKNLVWIRATSAGSPCAIRTFIKLRHPYTAGGRK